MVGDGRSGHGNQKIVEDGGGQWGWPEMGHLTTIDKTMGQNIAKISANVGRKMEQKQDWVNSRTNIRPTKGRKVSRQTKPKD